MLFYLMIKGMALMALNQLITRNFTLFSERSTKINKQYKLLIQCNFINVHTSLPEVTTKITKI